jgi:hypothetical protein
MRPYLLPECLAQADDVPVRLRFHQILVRRPTAPDPKTIEEVETMATPDAVLAGGSVGSEIDCAGEDAPEALNKPAVMRTVLRQVELFQDLGRGPKEYSSVLLSDG